MEPRWVSWTGVVAVAVGFAACTPDDDSVVEEAASGELAAPSSRPEAAGLMGGAEEVEAKRAYAARRAVEKRLVEIDWASAERAPRVDLGLDEESREILGGAQLPVLLPGDADWFEAVTFTSQDDWYAASMKRDGLSVYVSGTRVEFVHPHLDTSGIDAEEPRVTRNELIPMMTFRRWGATYVVEVECARPSEDVRCGDEDFVRELTGTLVRPGGVR